jgi:hypothetical protein
MSQRRALSADHPVDRMLELWSVPPTDDSITLFRDVYADPYRVNGASISVAEIVERASRIHIALRGLQHVLIDRVDDGCRTVVLLEQRGVHVGDLPSPLGVVPPTGRLLTRRFVELIDHDGQRLVEAKVIADDLARLVQAGAVRLTAAM